MKLQKIPGVKRYRALGIGIKQLGASAGVGAQTLEAARKISGGANAVGDATYSYASTPVRAGWNNELRAGAVARVQEPHWRDSRDAVLLRVTAAMSIRTEHSDRVVYTRKDGTTRSATKAQAANWSKGYR